MSVYKTEKPDYFNRSLQSVWDDQTLKPNEIILVKDGPLGDDLDMVVDKWKIRLGEKLIVVVNEENLGLTKSLNKAIAQSSGDILARMDSDDISMPNRFEKQAKFMASHPDIDVLGGGIQEINENEEWGAERLYPATTENIRKFIVKANPIAHPSAMIRKSIFDNGFKYDEQFRKNQDLKLWYDLLAAGHKLANLSEPVLFFRRTSETYAKRSSKISLISERNIYLNGITMLYGRYNWRKIYPMVRYLIKSMPPGVSQFVYKYLFKKKNT